MVVDSIVYTTKKKKIVFRYINYKQDAGKNQPYDLNTLSFIKLYGQTVKAKYFHHAKIFVERVQIP